MSLKEFFKKAIEDHKITADELAEKARLHSKEELPWFTDRRKDLEDALPGVLKALAEGAGLVSLEKEEEKSEE
jgi:hypothetical protein